MSTSQTTEFDQSWRRAAELLDSRFPLHEGSHRSATDYIVQFEHLLVIRSDGSCTGLARPSQFVEAGGHSDAPQSILLEEDGFQVEIEPDRGALAPVGAAPREHRMQLLTNLTS